MTSDFGMEEFCYGKLHQILELKNLVMASFIRLSGYGMGEFFDG